MNPLAIDIWFYIAFGYIFVSICIWIVARLSPIEWVNSKPPCSMACDHILREIQKENNFFDNEQLELAERQWKTSEIPEEEQLHLNPDRTFHGHQEAKVDDNVDKDDTSDDDNTVELVRIQNNFTLKNSFWFAIGALMQQGSDLYPRVGSTIY